MISISRGVGCLSACRNTLLCLLLALSTTALAAPDTAIALDSRESVQQQLKRAAELYKEKQYGEAAQLYLSLSRAGQPDQAAWALELYGVCLEQQRNHPAAMEVYRNWLEIYGESESTQRVQQRLMALETARVLPRAAVRPTAARESSTRVYGSSSLMYRGLRRELDGQDAETEVSALAADVDLNLLTTTGDFLWRGRVSGGYLSDQSDDGDSDARVSNLYLEVQHEPTGIELGLGRQRANDNGIYGYFDGVKLVWPLPGELSVSVVGGSVSPSSWKSSDSDRQVYGLGMGMGFPEQSLEFQVYAVEQTYDGITERRALGTEISWFSDGAHAVLVADYDIEFGETNNLMFNGSWDVVASTNLSLSLGYQRSPFLTASNATIGEFGIDLKELVAGLDEGIDVYDAALDKTALSRYGSLLVNQQVSDRLRIVGELYHYELSDLPTWDGIVDAPDSDSSTTVGVQLVREQVITRNDFLSLGIRYTAGEFADTVSVFADEKLRLNSRCNLLLRFRASQRTHNELKQDAYTVRPGVRLDWYFTPELLLDLEMGYEWLLQDFDGDDFEVQQGFVILGLRTRF